MEMVGRQLRQSRAVAVLENPDTAGTGVSIVNYTSFAGLTPPGVPAPGQVAVYGVNGAGTTPDSFTTSFGTVSHCRHEPHLHGNHLHAARHLWRAGSMFLEIR